MLVRLFYPPDYKPFHTIFLNLFILHLLHLLPNNFAATFYQVPLILRTNNWKLWKCRAASKSRDFLVSSTELCRDSHGRTGPAVPTVKVVPMFSYLGHRVCITNLPSLYCIVHVWTLKPRWCLCLGTVSMVLIVNWVRTSVTNSAASFFTATPRAPAVKSRKPPWPSWRNEAAVVKLVPVRISPALNRMTHRQTGWHGRELMKK